jgi:phage tail sheath protein FI
VAVEAGLHRSPANEPLVGALGTEVALSHGELDLMNPIGVNTILAPAGAGIVVWGARTLSSDPAQRQLRHVRLVRFVERNIVDGMRWVIHERSEPDLWDQIADELRGFFGLLFRAGVLGGPTPEQAFSVRCDHSTNNGLAGEGKVAAEFWINFDDGSQRAGRVMFVSG